jgi:hypothetical protein
MFPGYGMGMGELFVICIVGILSIGLPVAVLVLLVLIYQKMESIETLLKNK